MNKKKLILFLFIIWYILLGYNRDFTFVQINVLIYNKRSGDSYPISWPIYYLSSLEFMTIYYLKWVATALYTFVFFISHHIIIRTFYKNTGLKEWNQAFYILLFVLAGLSLGLGYLLGNMERGYTVSRMFMGILQSPIPLMFLIPIGIYLTKYKKLTNE